MIKLLQRFRRSPSFLHFHRQSSSASAQLPSTRSITTSKYMFQYLHIELIR